MLHRDMPTKMLNVLVATPSGRDGQGGIDRIMAALGDELDRQGTDNVHVEFAASRGKGHIALSPFYLAAFMARMTALRLAGKVDVVHINLSSRGSTYRKMQIAWLARLLGIPYVLHLHGGSYDEFWEADGFMSRRIRSLFTGAARILVLGRAWRDFVALRAPEAADRIVVLPNATAHPALPRRGGGDTAAGRMSGAETARISCSSAASATARAPRNWAKRCAICATCPAGAPRSPATAMSKAPAPRQPSTGLPTG